MDDSLDVRAPYELHPAFYGCFDWHSAVHGHWMLVKLIREFPNLPEQDTIRYLLDLNLTAENIAVELEYFEEETNKSFERTYGWAWLLKLTEELITWNDPQGKKWLEALQPLADHIVDKYTGFLPKLTYPNRTGEHPNTAFGLGFAWDYAVAADNWEFINVIESRAKDYYMKDADCPGNYEPGGFDFLSPCLIEADLMSRVLPDYEFLTWMHDFLPNFISGTPESLFIPATVTDRSDGKLVHLDGLNLSRSWCFSRLAWFYPEENNLIRGAAKYHLEITLPNISSGQYAGEHWLASFAIYAIFTGSPQ